MLSLPLFVVLLVGTGAAAGAAAHWWLSSRRKRLISSIEALRWGTYVHLVRRLLSDRGYRVMAVEPDSPGIGGYDFDVERDGSRHLVICRHGASILPTDERLADLQKTVRDAGAAGGMLFLTSRVGRKQRAHAQALGIEVDGGFTLARKLAPMVTSDLSNPPVWDPRQRAIRH
jgi:hypothetical protein